MTFTPINWQKEYNFIYLNIRVKLLSLDTYLHSNWFIKRNGDPQFCTILRFGAQTPPALIFLKIRGEFSCFYANFRLGLVIPQGTVDNKLGPDRLAGPKALDPKYCRQPTLWLHDLCLEVLTVRFSKVKVRFFGTYYIHF